MKVTPHRIAAASRALAGPLLDALALRSEQISDELARVHLAVPWDRQRLIGQMQQVLVQLRDERFARPEAGDVRVLERADQPLEVLANVWRQLRQGKRVWVDYEAGACTGGIDLLRSMADVMGYEVLRVAEAPGMRPEEVELWPLCGVEAAPRRLVAVAEDADPELAAYLVARAALRRTGFDPRCVHRVLVAGEQGRFERHLRRLFVGVRMGTPDDDEAFAGPVRAHQAEAFEEDLRAWRQGSGIEEVCPGGRLEGSRDEGGSVYLAPALLIAEGEELRGPERDPRGPTLIVQRVPGAQLESHLRAALGTSEGASAWAWVGESRPGLRPGPTDRWASGALAVSRLPPGLPLPRP